MFVKEKLYTNAEFWEFQQRPENENKNFELIYGVICEMPSASPLHGVIAARMLFFLMAYLEKYDLGIALGDNNDFALAEGLIYKPDAALILKGRLPKLPQHFEFAPDLAVEVVSPSKPSPPTPSPMQAGRGGNLSPSPLVGEGFRVRGEKVENYLRYGGQEVWIVYPEDRLLCVYRAASDGSLNLRKLTAADTLDGGSLLPDFSIKGQMILDGKLKALVPCAVGFVFFALLPRQPAFQIPQPRQAYREAFRKMPHGCHPAH